MITINYLVYPPNTLVPQDQVVGATIIVEEPKFDAGGTIWNNQEILSFTAETVSPIGAVSGGGPIDRRGRIVIEVITRPGFPSHDCPQILYTGVGNPGRIPISGGRVDSGIVDVREDFLPGFQLVHVFDAPGTYGEIRDRIADFEKDFRLTIRVSFRPT